MVSRLLCCFGLKMNEGGRFLEKESVMKCDFEQGQKIISEPLNPGCAKYSEIKETLDEKQYASKKVSDFQNEENLTEEQQLPSISCPSLTVVETTGKEISNSKHQKISNASGRSMPSDNMQNCTSSLRRRIAESPDSFEDRSKTETSLMSAPSKSLLTKTYSFKRIISFRSDNFRRGNTRYASGNGHSPNSHGRRSTSPYYSKEFHRGHGYNPAYKPLTFSFLGQIYAKKSIKAENHPKKKLEGKLSSPANICDDPNLTNTIEHDSPLEAENLEEDEV